MNKVAGKTLLITRPPDQAAADAAFFKPYGLHTVIASTLRYEDCKADLPAAGDIDALIVTSARGVDTGLNDLGAYRDKAIYCVGEQSADAARAAGFACVYAAAGTADDLIDLICTHEQSGANVLYLRGRDVSKDMKPAMENRGYVVQSRIVYSALEVEEPAKDVLDRLARHDIDAVGFYSKRSAGIFVKWIKAYGLEGSLSATKALCISDAVLECVRVLPWQDCSVSKMPDGNAMRRLCLTALGCVAGGQWPPIVNKQYF